MYSQKGEYANSTAYGRAGKRAVSEAKYTSVQVLMLQFTLFSYMLNGINRIFHKAKIKIT